MVCADGLVASAGEEAEEKKGLRRRRESVAIFHATARLVHLDHAAMNEANWTRLWYGASHLRQFLPPPGRDA